MKKTMISELEIRANKVGCSPLEWICDQVAEGTSLISIAEELSRNPARARISAGVLGTWVNKTPEGRAAIAQAREDASHLIVDQASELLDRADNDRDAIAKAKAQADHRTWKASKWNRKTYGNDAAQVNVQLNLGQLHLDALRQRAVQVVTAAPLLPSGEPDYEPDDGAPCQATV